MHLTLEHLYDEESGERPYEILRVENAGAPITSLVVDDYTYLAVYPTGRLDEVVLLPFDYFSGGHLQTGTVDVVAQLWTLSGDWRAAVDSIPSATHPYEARLRHFVDLTYTDRTGDQHREMYYVSTVRVQKIASAEAEAIRSDHQNRRREGIRLREFADVDFDLVMHAYSEAHSQFGVMHAGPPFASLASSE